MSVATTRPAEGEAFRALLRGHRLRLGWSQDGLAARAGMDLSNVNRIESGAREPSREACVRLASGLGLSETEADALLLAAGHLPTGIPADRLLEVIALVREATPGEATAALALVRAAHGR